MSQARMPPMISESAVAQVANTTELTALTARFRPVTRLM
jgi:hypothetical protein